jgi:hypothetical protein
MDRPRAASRLAAAAFLAFEFALDAGGVLGTALLKSLGVGTVIARASRKAPAPAAMARCARAPACIDLHAVLRPEPRGAARGRRVRAVRRPRLESTERGVI